MLRIFFILIAIYNFMFLSKSFALHTYYLEKIAPPGIALANTLIYSAFMIFLLVHSIMLLMYKKSSVTIQTVLCGIDLIIKILQAILLLLVLFHTPGHAFMRLMLLSIFIIIDSAIIIFIHSKDVKEVLDHAETSKEEKQENQLPDLPGMK